MRIHVDFIERLKFGSRTLNAEQGLNGAPARFGLYVRPATRQILRVDYWFVHMISFPD